MLAQVSIVKHISKKLRISDSGFHSAGELHLVEGLHWADWLRLAADCYHQPLAE